MKFLVCACSVSYFFHGYLLEHKDFASKGFNDFEFTEK